MELQPYAIFEFVEYICQQYYLEKYDGKQHDTQRLTINISNQLSTINYQLDPDQDRRVEKTV